MRGMRLAATSSLQPGTAAKSPKQVKSNSFTDGLARYSVWLLRSRQGIAAALLLCLCMAVLFAPGPAHAAPAIAGQSTCILQAGAKRMSLTACIARLIDPDRRMTINDASAPDSHALFQPMSGLRSGGFSPAAHWYRLTVQRAPHVPADRIFEVAPPFLDDVRVYLPNGKGGWEETRLGDHVPRDEVPLQTRMHTVGLTLPDTAPLTFYVRVVSRSSMFMDPRLWEVPAFHAADNRANFVHVLYFGMLGAVVLLYGAFGIVLREKALVFYAVYVAAMINYYLCINGFIAWIFTPQRPWLQDYATEAGVLGMNLAIMLMWASFTGVKKDFPSLRFIYTGATGLGALSLLSIGSSWYGMATLMSSWLTLAVSLLSMVLLTIQLRRAWDNVLLLYILAFVPGAIAGLMQISMTAGLIESKLFFAHIFQVASVPQVILLSLGFLLRIHRIQMERRHAEQEAVVAARLAGEQRKVVAMLSHEFRSPLAAIDRAAEMVEIGTPLLDVKARERLDRIRSHTWRMANLVDVFLTAEALDHGRLALRLEAMTAAGLIHQLRQRFAEEAASGRFIVEPAKDDCELQADHVLLGVALGNLIENAFRYSPPDKPVRLRSSLTGGRLEIEITDQGSGMSEEEIGKIGALYFRGQSSTGSIGSGLGLYIAKKVIDAHGGAIAVASAVGAGTTFTVTMPVAADQFGEAAAGRFRSQSHAAGR
jgi:signal transduction histidine kinase